MMRPIYFLLALSISFQALGQGPQKLIGQLKSIPDAEKPAICLSLSRYYAREQPDSAVDYASSGIRIAEARHDDKALGSLLLQLGDVNALHQNKQIARGFYNEALSVFRRIKDTKGMALAYDALGVLDGDSTDFNLALQYDRDSRDSSGVSATYIAMGKAAEKRGDTERALSDYLRALPQYTHRGHRPEAYFSLLQDIGRLYALKGKTAYALQYLRKGIRDSLEEDEPEETIRLTNTEGEALEKGHDEKDALAAYKQSLTDARKYRQPGEQAEALLHIANVLKLSDARGSIADLNQALAIAKKLGLAELEERILAALSGIYRQQKNYSNAIFVLEEQHRLVDSLLAADTVKDIRAQDTSYALERSHERVMSLEATNHDNRVVLWCALLVLAVIIVLLILLWLSFSKVKKLNVELAASNRVKDTLFSVIGHDLKGPAASAAQLFELLEAGDISESEMKPLISELRQQTNASLDLLQALFEWGKSQLQGIQVSPADFSASAMVNRSIQLLARQAAEKQLAINAAVPENLRIHADADHFAFVIRNLLANAIKFSYPGGQIGISANHQPNTNEVVIAVSDTGIGISQEQQALFHTANLKVNFGTQKEKGSGLGLLLAKDFLKANHGRIWLKSTEGKGTTFFVALPIAMS